MNTEPIEGARMKLKLTDEGIEQTILPDRLASDTPAEIDFSCRVCGVQCAIAPDPPARAVCPEHCEDHDYIHDSSRAAKFCQHCDQEEPEDWR